MDSRTLDTCLRKIEEANKPISLKEVRKRLSGTERFRESDTPEVEKFVMLRAQEGALHQWPPYRSRSPRFWGRSFRECVRESLLAGLKDGPSTAKGATERVRRRLAGANEAHAKTELAGLTSEGVLHRVVVGRQALYFSREWAQRLAGLGAHPAEGLAVAILTAVRELESAEGNYVRIDRLRAAPPVKANFDSSVIALADAGQLVLSAYDGPRFIAPGQAADFVEDSEGRLYVGVARPQSSWVAG